MVHLSFLVGRGRWPSSLLKKRGEQVSDLEGEPLIDPEAGILATNRCIHTDMLKILQYGIGLPDSTVFPSGQPALYSRTIPNRCDTPFSLPFSWMRCRHRGGIVRFCGKILLLSRSPTSGPLFC